MRRPIILWSLLLLVGICVLGLPSQALAASKADRAAMRSLDRITVDFLRASNRAARTVRARQSAYHNWFVQNSTGKSCFNQMYYMYKSGGDSPEQFRSGLQSIYQTGKYVYASAPLWNVYAAWNKRLARFKPRGISRQTSTNLARLRARSADTAKRLIDLSKAFSRTTTPQAALCDSLLEQSAPWTWNSRAYAFYASGMIGSVISRIRQVNSNRSLNGFARTLKRYRANKATISFVDRGGLGISFDLLNQDSNLLQIRTGTPDILANRAGIATLIQAKNLAAGYLSAFSGLPEGAAQMASAIQMLQMSSTPVWQSMSTGSSLPRAGLGAANQIYVFQSLAGPGGGAVFCVASKGSKNYCVAILGRSDEHPVFQISGTASAIAWNAWGSLVPGPGSDPATFQAPAGWQFGSEE